MENENFCIFNSIFAELSANAIKWRVHNRVGEQSRRFKIVVVVVNSWVSIVRINGISSCAYEYMLLFGLELSGEVCVEWCNKPRYVTNFTRLIYSVWINNRITPTRLGQKVWNGGVDKLRQCILIRTPSQRAIFQLTNASTITSRQLLPVKVNSPCYHSAVNICFV